jgi:hypothetical protein
MSNTTNSRPEPRNFPFGADAAWAPTYIDRAINGVHMYKCVASRFKVVSTTSGVVFHGAWWCREDAVRFAHSLGPSEVSEVEVYWYNRTFGRADRA